MLRQRVGRMARNRAACGPVAPPDRLYLVRVDYQGTQSLLCMGLFSRFCILNCEFHTPRHTPRRRRRVTTAGGRSPRSDLFRALESRAGRAADAIDIARTPRLPLL